MKSELTALCAMLLVALIPAIAVAFYGMWELRIAEDALRQCASYDEFIRALQMLDTAQTASVE